MHFVYVLHSVTIEKYYAGESFDPQERLIQHNTSFFRRSSTKAAGDWRIVLTICVKDRKEARIIERYIKSMKSRNFLYSISHVPDFYKRFKELVLEKFSINISE